MEHVFWHERWARNQTGFHLSEVNPYLSRHWPALGLPRGAQVLVPLCGKSLDLSWLAAQGYRVMGVELSQKAAEAFFSEQGQVPQVDQRGPFKVFQAGAIEIWCGDFFALDAQSVAGCSGFYDRAALIALPPSMRERYAAQVNALVVPGSRGLLITLDYDQAQKVGPPFAVTDPEVQRLLGAHWQLEVLEQPDVLGESWKFVQEGVTRLDERVYQVVKR
ncbi:thiopurine S-methyltransferase [Pseudomonas sp. SDO528_S397]